MSTVVMFISFRLAEGVLATDFLLAAQKLHSGFMSRQKGYINWKQMQDGDTWVDMLTWETAQDAQNADESSCNNALAMAYFALIDPQSITTHLFTVQKNYE